MRDDLTYLGQCANKATKGRWTAVGTWVENEDDSQPDIVCTQFDYDRGANDSHERKEADAIYIAAARPSVIKSMIAEIRELRRRDKRSERIIEKLTTKVVRAETAVANAQAKIDALMMEYCPDEMTPEQIESWRKHQAVSSSSDAETACRDPIAGGVMLSSRAHDCLVGQGKYHDFVELEPLTDGYVQPVPSQCDRILWRGSYYHLPIGKSSVIDPSSALIRPLLDGSSETVGKVIDCDMNGTPIIRIKPDAKVFIGDELHLLLTDRDGARKRLQDGLARHDAEQGGRV